jgi:hypothetical protein
VVSPFGSINAQTSDGNSTYNALNIDVKKRFSRHFQFLASYTWSHSIDDSSDLQTLLLPQDNRNFGAERADSLFDQRHRFVFSGVIASPSTGPRRWLPSRAFELHDRADLRDLVRPSVQHPEQPGHEQRPVEPNRSSDSAC